MDLQPTGYQGGASLTLYNSNTQNTLIVQAHDNNSSSAAYFQTTGGGGGVTIRASDGTNGVNGGFISIGNVNGTPTMVLYGSDQSAGAFMFLRDSNNTTTITFRGTGGQAYASAWNITSDRRLKSQIATLSDGISVVQSLRPVSYILNSDSKKHCGFIAQEVEEVIPNVVVKNDDTYSLNQMELIPFLVKSMQQLIQRVQTLEAKLSPSSS